MAGDEGFRANQDFTQSSQKSWVRKWGPYSNTDWGSAIHNYEFDEDIGFQTTNLPRWPLNPLDTARYLAYQSAEKKVKVITGDSNYKEYVGVTVNPQKQGSKEGVAEKNMKMIMPVGSEAVVFNDFLMPDIYSDYSMQAVDVIPQRQLKQWSFMAHTAVTAQVNLLAGYAAGTTQILVDTINIVYGLRPGQTISITTGGTARYYLIKAIDYNVGAAAGADALITLAWGLTVAVVNNDVITTAHAADAPIFFEFDSEEYQNLHSIVNCKQQDVSVPDADILRVEAFTGAALVLVTTVAIVPSGAGGIYTHPGGARGGVGLQLKEALETGDTVLLNAYFYDRIIRTFTIGRAEESGAARTGTTEADVEEVLVALKG